MYNNFDLKSRLLYIFVHLLKPRSCARATSHHILNVSPGNPGDVLVRGFPYKSGGNLPPVNSGNPL